MTKQGDKTAALNCNTDQTQTIIAIQERAVSTNPANGPQGKGWQEDQAFTLESRTTAQAIAFDPSDVCHTLRAEGFDASEDGTGRGTPIIEQSASSVRRLTPLECERLQGFPDGFTNVKHRKKPAADGPRYRAIGNSMAVPVLGWIGRRIGAVDDMEVET